MDDVRIVPGPSRPLSTHARRHPHLQEGTMLTSTPATMTAIVRDAYCSPDRLELREIDRPAVGDDDVLLQVRAAGLDQGVWHVVTGVPYLLRLAFGLRRPKVRVPGLDVAGTVEAVGAKVTRFRPGDEVFGTADGTFAEYACAHQDRFAVKPAALTFEQAATVPTSGCAALQGLRDAGRLQAGQHVLVTGAGGGVGSFAVQLAKALGARVTGLTRAAKTDLVRAIGADDVIDYTREDLAARPGRYDLVLDTAGNRRISHLRRALTPHGTLVIVGGAQGKGRWLAGADRQLRAMALSPFVGHTLRGLMSTQPLADLDTLREIIDGGRLTPVLDLTYHLAQVSEALRDLRSGRPVGKIAIVP